MCLINKILADLRGQERGSRILDCTNAFEDVGALELARGSAVLDDYVRECGLIWPSPVDLVAFYAAREKRELLLIPGLQALGFEITKNTPIHFPGWGMNNHEYRYFCHEVPISWTKEGHIWCPGVVDAYDTYAMPSFQRYLVALAWHKGLEFWLQKSWNSILNSIDYCPRTVVNLFSKDSTGYRWFDDLCNPFGIRLHEPDPGSEYVLILEDIHTQVFYGLWTKEGSAVLDSLGHTCDEEDATACHHFLLREAGKMIVSLLQGGALRGFPTGNTLLYVNEEDQETLCRLRYVI